jgi:hypothetical protein
MSFTPPEVDKMSIWEFAACVEGFNRAHGDGKPKPPTEDEFDDALAQWESNFGSAALN